MPESNPSAPGRHGTVRHANLRRRVVVLGVLVLAAFAASSAYDAFSTYRHTVLMNNRELGNVATALAEQTAWTWETVDLLLRETANWYVNDNDEVPPDLISSALAARTEGVRQVRRVTIIDAQGIERYHSDGSSPANIDVSDRSYFIVHRNGTASGLFMSEPLVTRTENRTSVVLSRRLEDRQGRFAGVVSAIVDLQDLKQFYGAVNLGKNGAIHLLRNDGLLLVRNPPAPGSVGRRFPEFAAAAGASASRPTSPIDGRREFIAVAPVRDTPLVIAVTRNEADALRPWWSEALRLAVQTLVLTVLGALTIAALVKQLRRIETGERALRESEERYGLAFEGTNEGHWDWELESDRLFLSPKFKSLHGLPEDLPAGTRRESLGRVHAHPDDVPRVEAAVADHIAGRTLQYEMEYRVCHPDGDWHWLRVRGRCMRNAAGEPHRFVGSCSDVTAQKQAQAEKEHLEAQLRQSQKMEAIGTLAGGIAHDFNNILGAILGYGELAQQHSPQGSALRRYIDNVMHAAGRARALVDRILGFSRSGLIERRPVNIQLVVEEALELIRASLPPAIRLDKQLLTGDAAVLGDATGLHQVTMNLCTNAIQAIKGAGVLSVRLERIELAVPRTLRKGQLREGAYVRLTVSDTGVGISADVVDRIFDPFFTTKGVGEGTGLGLSLVHGIVEDLGGVIELSTRVGEGTTFSIWLPMSGESPKPAAEAPPELPRGQGESVMIVDDEPALVSLTEEMLAELGYEPVGFGSSAAALRAFEAGPERFDLVLTDETMPDLTGTELACQIRKVRPEILIVLMSGHWGPRLAQRARAAGVGHVLRKPLQKRDLAEAFARLSSNRTRVREPARYD